MGTLKRRLEGPRATSRTVAPGPTPIHPRSGSGFPADEAEENIGYQKIAWYGAPFGDAGSR